MDHSSFWQIFSLTSGFSVFLPLLLWVLHNKSFGDWIRVFGIYVIVKTVTELTNISLGLNGVNNMPVANLFTLFEFVFLGWYYSRVLKIPELTRLFPWMAGGFAILVFVNAQFIEGWLTFNTYPLWIASVFIISICILFLFKLFKELKVFHLEHDPLFWISSGLLFYFSGTLFLFITSHYYYNTEQGLHLQVWSINHFLNILVNILIAVGFYYEQRKNRQNIRVLNN